MKKYIALLLSLALCLGLCPALGEETAPDPAGDWYAVWKDVTLQLTLQPGGAYTLRVLGAEKALSGAWEEEDGFIRLSGDTEVLLSFDDPVLRQADLDLLYYREPFGAYTPAEVSADADVSAYAGCWYSRYVLIENAVLPAEWAGQDVRMLIEENIAAITGTGFDSAVVPFAYENGALTAALEGKTVTLQRQQDGCLRLTVRQDGKTTVLILNSFTPDSLFPDAKDTGE